MLEQTAETISPWGRDSQPAVRCGTSSRSAERSSSASSWRCAAAGHDRDAPDLDRLGPGLREEVVLGDVRLGVLPAGTVRGERAGVEGADPALELERAMAVLLRRGSV